MSIFKAYDIRGVVPQELDEETAYRIGLAIVRVLDARQVVVGQDMRASSPALFQALSRGITEAGADVLDIGLASTPMSYFACAHLGAGGSVMITASHNPSQYNGFKISREQAIPVSYETGISEVEALVHGGISPAGEPAGRVIEKKVMSEYVAHVVHFAGIVKPLTLVADAGNGIAGYTVPPILERLPQVRLIPLYFELDGSFPNHEPNPLKSENMRDLQAAVREHRADLGVAFDGDADRAIFVDETGEIISADLLTALLAQGFLKQEPGQTILYDVRSSRVVRDVVEQAGGTALMSRVGHSYMKALLRERQAVFGGELAGHYYYRDNFYTDSGVVTLMHVLATLSQGEATLSQRIRPLRVFHASGEINFTVEDKEAKIQEIEALYSDGEVSHIDGVRVDYEDWWFNVRKSNTEPLLRLVLEARTREKMEAMRDQLSRQIQGE